VDAILEHSQNPNTKFFALQVLDNVIKYRWSILPPEQCDGIKTFISNLTIKLSGDEAAFRRERSYVNKLNAILVQVVKQDWPHRWPSFIKDLTGAAKMSEPLCENCMNILKLLSEDVFNFSRESLTQEKTKLLKGQLQEEFGMIHELAEYVLANSQKPELIRVTLQTLHAFLSWVPLGYIFDSNLVESLLNLFPTIEFRNVTLQCLAEIGALNVGSYYDRAFVKMYSIFITNLQLVLPRGTNIPEAYANGSDDDQEFVQNLALFLSAFFENHIALLEGGPMNGGGQEGQDQLLIGLEYLLGISYVDDTEVLKVCLDYWNHLVCHLFQVWHGENDVDVRPFGEGSSMDGDAMGVPGSGQNARRELYEVPLSKLRLLMMSRMAKPEEVLVVEDDAGNIVRETMKDSDVLAQYKQMRETLVFLSHLDHNDTQNQMLEKLAHQLNLAVQLNGKEYSWNALNCLCWAIGSISGSMVVDQENKFLVTVIRDLLDMCRFTRGKDHKAVIASNIMYVVGQYPRFLQAHWKFLKTVVNKLFEFMHECHPGVQDMACDTFLKIARKCKRKFVMQQLQEQEPFINELLRNLGDTIKDLENHQIHVFYEAVGEMIRSEKDPRRRDEYLAKLMELPNNTWNQVLAEARMNAEVLKQHDVIRNIANILQSNTAVATSLGHSFHTQITLIYTDMLNMYKWYSELISSSIAEGGPYAARHAQVKLMRSVKRAVLKLIETFVEKTDEPSIVATQFVPVMLDPILGDYARNVPDARDPEVLSLFAAIFNKVQGDLLNEVPRVFEACFQCTLQMITRNFEDYPEHRPKFFALLRAITNHCFRALFSLSPENLKLVMDSIVWAFRHTERTVAETGLNLLLELMKAFQNSEYVNEFYQTYYLTLMQEIFAVLTDTFHRPGFKLHAQILQHLILLSTSNAITAPLWDQATLGPAAYPSNLEFVRHHITQLLTSSFPNMGRATLESLVIQMFEAKEELVVLKGTLRDFMVQSKEFGSDSSVNMAANKELWAEEEAQKQQALHARNLAIPGMIGPNEFPLKEGDDMADA